MNVTVFGAGYVGLVAAACLAEVGHIVLCIDKDKEKVLNLKRGIVPLHEPGLQGLVSRNLGERLLFSGDGNAASLRDSDIFLIAVGTPARQDGTSDLSAVQAVLDSIVQATQPGRRRKFIVQKSTVPVGTSERLARALPPHLEMVCNPEFLREGNAVQDFFAPHRIVLGTDDQDALETMRQLYQPLLARAATPPQWIETSLTSAEMIKQASNAFLATKISFINHVAALCEATGADVADVAYGMGADPRIGEGYLQAGIGYGGSCFPKDVAAFRRLAQECDETPTLMAEVERLNAQQRRRFVEKTRCALNGRLKGRRLAVLGLAFKGGTDDVRESPALDVVSAVLQEGCAISAYDPVAGEALKARFAPMASRIKIAGNPYEAAQHADALLILADWEEFRCIDLLRLKSVMHAPVVIDGRNLFHPVEMAEHGFTYVSIGRPTMAARSAKGMVG